MTDKPVPELSGTHVLKAHASSVNTPGSHAVLGDQTATLAFQPDMFDDDLVSALAVARENVRARQVFDWERIRRQCAV